MIKIQTSQMQQLLRRLLHIPIPRIYVCHRLLFLSQEYLYVHMYKNHCYRHVEIIKYTHHVSDDAYFEYTVELA